MKQFSGKLSNAFMESGKVAKPAEITFGLSKGEVSLR